MSDNYNYVKHITHSATFHETNAIQCDTADLSSGYSSTFREKELKATGSVKAVSDHASTLSIERLQCASAELVATYASILTVNHIDCDQLTINADYSSTLKILGGRIGTINGVIMHASNGIHKNISISRDNVEVGPGCYWGEGGLLSASASESK